ncbi:hypothetical protein NFI96_008734, partial [Prochilodus magdalenae]
ETDPDFNHCAVCIEGYQLNDVVRILPCKHVFHKMCVDPWLNEHCTCPMCKLNILKALGIMPNLPCVDNVAFDMERVSRSQSSSQRGALVDLSESVSLEPLRLSSSTQLPSDSELTARTDINIAVTKEWFIVASFGVLSALTLCYMIIRATSNGNPNTDVTAGLRIIHHPNYPARQRPVGQRPVGPSPVGPSPVGQRPVGQRPVGQRPVGQSPVGPSPVSTDEGLEDDQHCSVQQQMSYRSHFFSRSSGSPRNVVCEMELPDIQASLDMYDENKS